MQLACSACADRALHRSSGLQKTQAIRMTKHGSATLVHLRGEEVLSSSSGSFIAAYELIFPTP